MARRFFQASRIYAPGSYGPLRVDRFTRDDTNALQWAMTVEGWPDTLDTIAIVSVLWELGINPETGEQNLMGGQWGVSGRQINRDGTPKATVSERVTVPLVYDAAGNGRKDVVATGYATLLVLQSFRTAITLEAVT